MDSCVIPSAAYFTVFEHPRFLYGVITVAMGRHERKVLCRQHAYLQLKELERSGQVDEFEAMHLRSQIEDSQLPLVFPSELQTELQSLIDEQEDLVRNTFVTEYFHPDAEELLKNEVPDVSVCAGRPISTILQ